MSIKERLTKVDPQLAEQRKKQAVLQKEIEALKASLQKKEEEYSTHEQELAQKSDINAVLKEGLSEQVRLLEEREKNYRSLKREGLLTEESISKDKRIMDSYDGLADLPDVQKDMKKHYDSAQRREVRRKKLEQPMNLEILVGREQVSNAEKFVDRTHVIAPIIVSQYKAFHQQDHEPTLADNLLEWLMGNLLTNKVSPRQEEYHGFFKVTIAGTPELNFDSELPDEFKEANVNVKAVVLGGKEFLLGEALPLTDVPQPTEEYTLSTGKKVDASKIYTTSEVAELLGYAGNSSVRYIIAHGAEREQKGLPRLAAEEHYPEGDHTRRRTLGIPGQNVIDFDQQLNGKRKDVVAVPPAQSVDGIVDEAVVQPSVPKSGVEEKASGRIIAIPDKDYFTVAEIANIFGVGYGHAGDLVKNHPRSEEWKVKGQSRSGYVFKDIPRAVVEEMVEKHKPRHAPMVIPVSTDHNLVGLVEASRYIVGKLKECGVEYALSSVCVGIPAKTYAEKYLNHKSGPKLPAERGEKNRILVRRDGLEAFVDEYVKEEVIKPKVKAGESYEEITAELPEKYHGSVKAFLARRSQGDYKRRTARKEPVIPTQPLEEAVGEEAGAEREAIGEVADDKDYYTTSKAAAIVGVSSRMIQNYIAQGKISAERRDSDNIRSGWRISKTSLDEYLVKIGKKPAEIVKSVSVEVLAASSAPRTASVEQPPRPSLPQEELERRYKAIESTLGESYASRIKATTNENIGDIEQRAFDEVYLPLLGRVWSKIREMHPGEIPEDFSPLLRPATFSNPDRLAKLEAKVNVHYSQFTEKNAEKKRSEREITDKITFLNMYAGLDERTAKELLPNLDSDGGVDRIDALEKVLAGVAKDKLTDAATKILQTNVGILIANFDFEAYRAKLASTLEKISSEYTGEIPDFYNPLKTPQNFTDVGALENVARVLKKARAKKGRSSGSVSPDRAYYTQYTSGTAKAVEGDGFNLGMVCAIVDHGINVRGRKGFAGKTMSAEVLRKKVSGFYNGKFDGRVYENNLRSMVTCGAMLEQDKFGKSVYSLAIKLPDSVPASIREVLQPFYVVATTCCDNNIMSRTNLL